MSAQRSWSPPRQAVAAGWLAAAVAGVLAIVADDASGRLFGAVAAGVLGAAALFGTVARPRLAVDEGGVAVRGLFGVRRYPWARVRRLHVVRHHRLGRQIPMLELDAVEPDGSERLIVLGRLDLGTHPDEVVAALPREW